MVGEETKGQRVARWGKIIMQHGISHFNYAMPLEFSAYKDEIQHEQTYMTHGNPTCKFEVMLQHIILMARSLSFAEFYNSIYLNIFAMTNKRKIFLRCVECEIKDRQNCFFLYVVDINDIRKMYTITLAQVPCLTSLLRL